VAREAYTFSGRSGGRGYSSVGLRLRGVSDGYNDNALSRRVVAHGAPYVTPKRAGMSEGCPAMEQQRARRLLPKLADGGLVFLFAPDSKWMTSDPWIVAAGE
ncbi:MAG: murein L,D-transpeptidase catalytic domain-containing protein, partial [Gemmatimonadaceae bacterium]